MSATLKDLHDTLTKSVSGNDLTISSGASGVPALDELFAALPAQALPLKQAQVTFDDQQQPATLTVTGALQDAWPVPGLSGEWLRPQAVTITYQQGDPDMAVSAGFSVTGALAISGSTFDLTGTLADGPTLRFSVSPGQSNGPLLADVAMTLGDVALPDGMGTVALRDVAVTWSPKSGDWGIGGSLDLSIPLGPKTFASTLTLAIDSSAGADSKRATSGKLTGTLALDDMDFELVYDLQSAGQKVDATWNAEGKADFTSLAAAFGLQAPTVDLTLPDLGLQTLAFETDWSDAGEQSIQFTGTTALGDAFFLVDRPKADQPWGFVFGGAVKDATRLSHILAPAGIDADALDFIALQSAFFLVSSAQFSDLGVAALLGLGEEKMSVSQGASAGVLLDLDGSTPARPDVAALKTVLAGHPPVLAAQVTLSTNIAAIAVTAQLDGDLKISGTGTSALTLSDCAVVLKLDPLDLTVRGSLSFLVGRQTVQATGLLTVGETGITAAFDIHGQDGGTLPAPVGFTGVHLTDLGMIVGVTLEPPSVEAGVLGRFVIGPDPAPAVGMSVQARALTAMPPANEFVMVLGLDGELPNLLLLSMYLQELSFAKAIEAITNQEPQNLPDILGGLTATGLTLYWCDAVAGIQQPDGTWAYAGFGFNAAVDLYGFHAHAALKIDSTGGITGDACIDPIHIPGVLDLTGDGPGTPAAYTGQATVQPGGALIHVSTAASPYLDIAGRITLFGTVSESLHAEVTTSGLTFELDASTPGFSSTLQCAVQRAGHFEMHFSIQLNLDIDLGSVAGVRLGRIHLADTEMTAAVVADVTSGFVLTIDGDFELDGNRFTMPTISVNVPFSSLEEIPGAIVQQVQTEAEAVFKQVYDAAATYAGMVGKGIITGVDKVGDVLRDAFGQTADEAAALAQQAGYACQDVAAMLQDSFNTGSAVAQQILNNAGYEVGEINSAMTALFDWSAPLFVAAGETLEELGTHVGDFVSSRTVHMVVFNMTDHHLQVTGSDGGEITPNTNLVLNPGDAAVVATYEASTGTWEWLFLRDTDTGTEYQLYIQESSVVGNKYASFDYFNSDHREDNGNATRLPENAATSQWDGSPVAVYKLLSV